VLIDLMNGADVGVVQGGSCLRLALETGQGLRIFGHCVGQEFQGYKAVQLEVFRLVDHAHAPTTELLDQAVVRNGLADHWRKSYVGERGESTKEAASQTCHPEPRVLQRSRSHHAKDLCILPTPSASRAQRTPPAAAKSAT
jgi:hypothetical protein